MKGAIDVTFIFIVPYLSRTFAGRRRGEAPLDARPHRAEVRPAAAPPDSLGRDHVELVPRLLVLMVLLSFLPGSLSRVLALKGVNSGQVTSVKTRHARLLSRPIISGQRQDTSVTVKTRHVRLSSTQVPQGHRQDTSAHVEDKTRNIRPQSRYVRS